MIHHPPRPTHFPYTTLFRSQQARVGIGQLPGELEREQQQEHDRRSSRDGNTDQADRVADCRWKVESHRACRVLIRSEEHTSELQSQSNLVCRLLLEKKKIQG